jgi:hypothetical protein
MHITVTITREAAPLAPESIAHSVTFPVTIDNHRLVQLARDAAEAAAIAYLVHGEELRGAPARDVRPVAVKR